jgi:predicted transposase YbfD/YdcC
MMSFLNHFESVEDPHSHINKKYELLDLLFLTITAILSGAEGWKDIEKFGRHKIDWLRKFRPFETGIPVDDTIARAICILEPNQLTESFITWVNEIRQQSGHQLIAIDGKTLRHSHDGDTLSALHSITVWMRREGLIFCQQRSAGKKNEIKTVQSMLELIELNEQVTLTLDAMHCQKKTAERIVKDKAHYILSVKSNQKTLYEEIRWWFDGFNGNYPEEASVYEQTDAGHGRIEQRQVIQLPLTPRLTTVREWPGSQSIIQVIRKRIEGEHETSETVYYLSTHENDAAFVAEAIRSHWEVENKAHWVLDVIMREDDSRIRKGHAAENMAIFRRLCLNLARLHPTQDSVKGKLKDAAWNDDFRESLLFG